MKYFGNYLNLINKNIKILLGYYYYIYFNLTLLNICNII